jgi:hypothetical protein
LKWRNAEAANRSAERRKREDEAPRLIAKVPSLETLRLEVFERSSSIVRPEHTHVRHVVVPTAPALFFMPCHDSQCRDGGHDLTLEIMAALQRKAERFDGEHACPGVVGSASCSRVLGYVGIATYARSTPPVR